MRRIKLIALGFLVSSVLQSQVVFKAIVPRQVVAAGESFQIQYLLDERIPGDEFTPPPFKGFRIVSGPYTYSGSSINDPPPHLRNVVFTLVALQPGRYVVPAARARFNGRRIKTEDLIIDVLGKIESAANPRRKVNRENPSEYFLSPGEDPYEKMERNLFIEVLVDRTTCYVGQPVVATFKLYSRLESKSDIVKNPGFYGFTVQDIANLSNNITRTEIISGKAFDVHTIRVVQLYPLQPGNYSVDPMEVTNKVEFSKSVVNRKPEQEIIEGVVEPDNSPGKTSTVTYENHISTKKIVINVKPYPAAKKPVTFNGATGRFAISASLEKNGLAKNEEGALIITIRGKGNFTQLPAPIVQWPAAIEGFEPVIEDSLDKTQAPLRGYRTFRFPFVSGKAGDYSIPSISFSFFDPDSNRYKTISSDPVTIKISNEEKKEQPRQQNVIPAREKKDYDTIWLYGSIFIVVLLIILLQLRKPGKNKPTVENIVQPVETGIPAAEMLRPVQFSLVAGDGGFYPLLQKCIWEYLSVQLKLSGTRVNKAELYKAMTEKGLEEQYRDILAVLQECEAAMFTKADMAHDKQELLDKTRTILMSIKT